MPAWCVLRTDHFRGLGTVLFASILRATSYELKTHRSKENELNSDLTFIDTAIRSSVQWRYNGDGPGC